MKGKYAVCTGIVALMGLLVFMAMRMPLPDEGVEGRRRKTFDRTLLESATVRRHGYYGIDFVKCGVCRVEKRRLGGWVLGGFNTLVLEDLSVVVPSAADLMYEENAAPASNAARAIIRRLGLSDAFLRARGGSLRFSGLRVKNFSLSVLDAATNVVPCVYAAAGEARRDGLHLRDCDIIASGSTNNAPSAVLKVSPEMRVVWAGGELKL